MNRAPLLVDLAGVPACHCDDAFEHLHKALAESPDGDDRSIWVPHPNPYIRDHIEEATRRLQAVLVQLQDALARALTGAPIGELAKAMAPWVRWGATQMQEVREYLEGKPRDTFTLDDWLLLVDFLVQRYLPDDVILEEAEYLTVRAAIAGKVEAAAASHKPGPEAAAALTLLVPTTFAHVPERILTPVEQAVLHVAHARAVEAIRAVTGTARHRMKALIIEHVQAMVLGQREGQSQALRQRLFDEFGTLNRDFRRIAITEVGECATQGFVAAQPPGRKLQRSEAYQGACEWCRSIHGKIMTVVDPTKPDKNGDTEIWLGKTNVGRSAAPRKRRGGELVEREPHERWWIAAGVQHPHCRGAWVPVTEKPPEVSQDFADWLEGAIAASHAAQHGKEGR